MLAQIRKIGNPIEVAFLLALCLFLPLLEAPKNLAWLGFAGVWFVNRIRNRNFGGCWDKWDTLIAIWIGSALLSAAFAGLHRSEWGGSLDLVRYASVLWLVKRGRYSARVLTWALGTLVISTLVGLLVGHARLWGGLGKSGTLQLHSVGHVNHTAIYLAIMLGMFASWIFARWQAWNVAVRIAALCVFVVMLGSLVMTSSRAAVVAGLFLVPLLGAAWWRRWRAPLFASLVITGLLIAGLVGFGADVVRKQLHNAATDNVLAYRDGVWRMGYEAWRRYPVFGVGMDNFSLITHDVVKQWRLDAGKTYDPARYIRFPHGHSLYVNTLAERGAFGLAALGFVLIAWFTLLVRNLPRSGDEELDSILWGGAASAWVVTVVVGVVNTTLHHEHGILAVLLLGLWLCRLSVRHEEG